MRRELLGALALALAGGDALAGSARERFPEPPPLPEGISGLVRPGDAAAPMRVDRIADIFDALRACWRPPAGSGFSGQEITVRLSFKRSGEVLGRPRITYYRAGSEPDGRGPFTDAVRETLNRCQPLPFTERFGAAIAGRPFTIRFSDTRPL